MDLVLKLIVLLKNLQNVQQYYSLFGLSWLEHSEFQMEQEKGGNRVYEYRSTLRKSSHDPVLKYAYTTKSEGYPAYGVKGHSRLSKVFF